MRADEFTAADNPAIDYCIVFKFLRRGARFQGMSEQH